jgi:structural maintenance of chromosome 3 (chondroitin sulfate proteoglycan 6)
VAGTRVYDDRREESLRILEETGSKREKIDEVLVFLDERLAELEKEKEELKGYQEHDRSRRVLEYTIYSKELTDINQKLQDLEGKHEFRLFLFCVAYSLDSHMRDISEMATLHKHSKNLHEELKTAEKDLKNLNVKHEKLKKEKDFVQTDLLDLQQKKAQLDLKVNQSTSVVSIDAKKQKEYAQELSGLKKEIAKAKKQLDSLQPNYTTAVKKEQDIRERYHYLSICWFLIISFIALVCFSQF